jgi:hypothetical protein
MAQIQAGKQLKLKKKQEGEGTKESRRVSATPGRAKKEKRVTHL